MLITSNTVPNFKKRMFEKHLECMEHLYENDKKLYSDGADVSYFITLRKSALAKFKRDLSDWLKTQRLIEPWIKSIHVSVMPVYGMDYVPNILKDFTYYSTMDVNLEQQNDTTIKVAHAIHIENYNFVYVRKASVLQF